MESINLFDVKPQNRKLDIIDITTGRDMGLVIELRPGASLEIQKVERVFQSNLMAALRKNRDTTHLTEARRADTICAAVVKFEWSENPTFDGKRVEKFDADEKNLRQLAKSKSLAWLSDQIIEAVADEAGFTYS